MGRTKDDAADAVYRELVDQLGEDWSIDDFPPDREESMKVFFTVPSALVELPAVDAPAEELLVGFNVELRLPVSALHQLEARAAAANTTVDRLVSEWVTAEAGADSTISRDEVLALLARHHPRSA
ncbi:hypothetical protein ACWF9G_22845 [Nocardia sp. NPDC055029]